MGDKKILVIGSGASGLPTIKSCKEVGLNVVCYEKAADFGGLWRYSESSVEGSPSLIKSTITNTSKELNAYSDFPPPSHFPIFQPHEIALQYFELYAVHFDLVPCIHFLHHVVQVSPSESYDSTGQWEVKTKNLSTDEIKTEIFDGVIVCTGHHAFPSIPEYRNQSLFAGELTHSHYYKTAKGFEDKSVLVIGGGSSATDIATDLSGVAKKIYWSMRRPGWIYPRYIKKGKPIDIAISRRSFSKQPSFMVEKKLRHMINSYMDHERFEIHPRENAISQHPTINDEIKLKLANGTIILKKGVKEFNNTGVIFDEEIETTDVDTVIFATGYSIKYPFLNEDIIEVSSSNKVFLYKSVFPPQLKHPSLAFVGVLQPNGALFPVFEMQARWIAAIMAEKCKLPSPEEMLKDVRKQEEIRSKNYVQSPRHSIEVNKLSYMDDLAKQIKAKPNLVLMLFRDPKLFKICFFGPTLSYQYRLNGPFKWEGARLAILSYKSRLYNHFKNDKKITCSEVHEKAIENEEKE